MKLISLTLVAIIPSLYFQTCISATAAPPLAHVASVPLVVLSGNDSRVKQLAYSRISSSAEWNKAWLNHLGVKDEAIFRPALEIDFDRCCVVAVFKGEYVNTCRLEVKSVRDVGNATVIRFDAVSYQSGGAPGNRPDRVTPYAFIVIPKTDRLIVLEENVQSYLGEPPVWKEVAQLTAKKK
jgi:hypothetical protein